MPIPAEIQELVDSPVETLHVELKEDLADPDRCQGEADADTSATGAVTFIQSSRANSSFD